MVVDVVKRPGDGKEYFVNHMIAPFLHYISNLVVSVSPGVALQMASRVSTALGCPLSAGQLIVSVSLLLAPSAAARYSQLLGNVSLL